MRQMPDTLRLPARLLDEIGENSRAANSQNGRSLIGARKERRKNERAERKRERNDHRAPPAKRQRLSNGDEKRRHQIAATKSAPVVQNIQHDDEKPPKPKSILKAPKKSNGDVIEAERIKSSDSAPSQTISRAIRDKLAEDDAEIAFLERKLGIKNKKSIPKSLKDDGLSDILEGIDEIFDDSGQQDQLDSAEWLATKRSKARGLTQGEDEFETDEDGESEASEIFSEESFLEEDEAEVDDDESFSGFESDQTPEPSSPKRARENPYVPPPTSEASSTAKYIPPSLRKPASSDSENLVRLRRQVQGLVNRLTESNLLSILGDVEKLYRDHPRQNVTSLLVDVLLTSVCEPTSLPDTLIILPAGFIAAVYKVVGTDFGAQVIQSVVGMFDDHYQKAVQHDDSETSKETSNLITLISELYNFQVIGSNLMFDYIRMFLGKLSELNAELLLRIIRMSGPQLRQDDPSALKDIVSLLRPAASLSGEENISVRTKFMIETINDLKNNRLKKGAAASIVVSEHNTRMKKLLGSLSTRTLKVNEPLRIGLEDIRQADKRGKWWLVGASWAGNQANGEVIDTTRETEIQRGDQRDNVNISVDDAEAADIVQLAREHRMNTDVRRAIFITIMSSSDYQDAYQRLLKLRLKKAQEFEIPKILIHCLCSEQSYNPYYTLIAKMLCGNRRLKKALQFSLWNLYKRMGEEQDEDEEDMNGDDDDQALDSRKIIHLAKMFGFLVADGTLDLDILKYLNLTYLQPKTTTFVEVLLITVFIQSQRRVEQRNKDSVRDIFLKVKADSSLIRGLEHFIKKVVKRTTIAGGKAEETTVRWTSDVAVETLQSWAVSSLGA